MNRMRWLMVGLLWAVVSLWAQGVSSRAGDDEPRILFLGDSLAAGYEIGKEHAFPALIQAKIRQFGLSYTVINAGVSGDTSAGGLRRLAWILRGREVVLVLALGANDGLRGVPSAETAKNLQAIIDRARQKIPHLKLVIVGMKVPPNLGSDYAQKFEGIFAALAKKNRAVLIPFLLKGVAGRPHLNLADGIHPTAEGHALIAETVWHYLEPLL